jgi:hypothetical protein
VYATKTVVLFVYLTRKKTAFFALWANGLLARKFTEFFGLDSFEPVRFNLDRNLCPFPSGAWRTHEMGFT